MNEAPRPLRAGHRSRLVSTLGTLAIALVSAAALASCSLSSLGQPSSAGHVCADKAATAVTSGKTTAGVWACLDPKFQTTLHTLGMDGDGAFDFSGSNVMNVSYLGAHGDVVVYDVILSVSGQTKSLVLVVWVNSAGLVTNIGIGSPAF